MALDLPASTAIPTTAELLDRAGAMIPTLRQRSKHCEDLRQIPPETVQDLVRAGFPRIAQPTKFGGFGLGVDVIGEVAMEIGRGCGSTAWMTGQWPGHQFMVGWLPLECQEEYWGRNPDTLSSTASAVARLNITPERGGWRIRDTQMRFSSGCDYAEWILLLGPHGQCLVPKSDFKVLDDWFVAGLRGTGSKSIVIEDAWVPPHRFVSMEDLTAGTTPGAKAYPELPYYRAPMIILNQLLLSPTVGAARGVLDLFEERVTKRIDLHTGKPASEGAGAQLRFAKSHAEVDAAIMFVRRNFDRLLKWGLAGHRTTVAERTVYRRDTTYAARLCVQATNRLLSQGDASGMFDNNQIGRLGRDVYMAALQATLTWDEPAQSFSRARWGLEPISYLNG